MLDTFAILMAGSSGRQKLEGTAFTNLLVYLGRVAIIAWSRLL